MLLLFAARCTCTAAWLRWRRPTRSAAARSGCRWASPAVTVSATAPSHRHAQTAQTSSTVSGTVCLFLSLIPKPPCEFSCCKIQSLFRFAVFIMLLLLRVESLICKYSTPRGYYDLRMNFIKRTTFCMLTPYLFRLEDTTPPLIPSAWTRTSYPLQSFHLLRLERRSEY